LVVDLRGNLLFRSFHVEKKASANPQELHAPSLKEYRCKVCGQVVTHAQGQLFEEEQINASYTDGQQLL
jgi:hypothetical protein